MGPPRFTIGCAPRGSRCDLPDHEMLGVTVPQGPVLVAADGWRTARDASTSYLVTLDDAAFGALEDATGIDADLAKRLFLRMRFFTHF
jgi:hypothetical protein